MLKVGLTGSIAVGKSHVLAMLAELGARVIDADQIAREVVTRDSEGLRAVVAHFGDRILTADGLLDRPKLGQIVFADPAARKTLNSILHPLIISKQDELLRRFEQDDPDSIAVIDAALMIESGGYKRLDKLIVVHCRPEIQLSRLMKRDGLSREAAQARIGAQMPQEEKQKYADFLIDTSGDYPETRKQVEAVFRELKVLTRAAERS
jgi:dephospho-CoA kinase